MYRQQIAGRTLWVTRAARCARLSSPAARGEKQVSHRIHTACDWRARATRMVCTIWAPCAPALPKSRSLGSPPRRTRWPLPSDEAYRRGMRSFQQAATNPAGIVRLGRHRGKASLQCVEGGSCASGHAICPRRRSRCKVSCQARRSPIRCSDETSAPDQSQWANASANAISGVHVILGACRGCSMHGGGRMLALRSPDKRALE